jgi:serine/threonine-protein kinase
LNGHVPADVEQVVLRCLAKKPADRYPDAGHLMAALDRCRSAGEWTRADANRWWREHRAETAALDTVEQR